MDWTEMKKEILEREGRILGAATDLVFARKHRLPGATIEERLAKLDETVEGLHETYARFVAGLVRQ